MISNSKGAEILGEDEYTSETYKSGFYKSTEKHSGNKEWSFSGGIQKTESPNYFNGYDSLPTNFTASFELWINIGKRFFMIGYRSVRRLNI